VGAVQVGGTPHRQSICTMIGDARTNLWPAAPICYVRLGTKRTNQPHCHHVSFWPKADDASKGRGGRVPTSYSSRRKWGVSWQITPRVLTEALAAGGDKAKRAFDAVMGIKKIDIAAIEAARLKTGSDRLL